MSRVRTGFYFDDEELCALACLLSLVRYDDLASEWYRMLPLKLRESIANQEWNQFPLNENVRDRNDE